jgi:hypothetical protein
VRHGLTGAAHQNDFGQHPQKENKTHGRQDQGEPEVLLFLIGVHAVSQNDNTLVAVASSLGGVSKVWKGAGEGTSHSKPSAASQGRWGAVAP